MTSKHKTLDRSSALLLVFLLLTIGVSEAGGHVRILDGPQSNGAKILLTAVDKDGRFVTALRAEDLRLLVNGVPQKIENFAKTTDRTISIAILIDTSASQERTLPAQKSAANSFLDSVMRPGVDRVAVATFTGTLAVEQKLTNDLTLLRQAIARAQFVPPPGYKSRRPRHRAAAAHEAHTRYARSPDGSMGRRNRNLQRRAFTVSPGSTAWDHRIDRWTGHY